MRIHIITTALPPKMDGIGDYTALLAAELGKTQDVCLLTAQANLDSISGVKTQTVFDADDPRSVWNLLPQIEVDKPDWVLLQYQPFMYGRWGLNLHLPRVMQQIKRRCSGTKIALMVHEPFVPIITPQFAVMATWQRWQLWRLGQSANVIYFSIEAWQKRFQKWFPSKSVQHLPVGSNIPRVPMDRGEARARLGVDDATLVLGLFGTASAGRLLGRIRDAATALQEAGSTVQVLYIGPHTAQVCAALHGVEVIAGGPASAEEVSRRFAAMDIYLVPYIDGISTRRTTLMTALQHGVATVGTSGPLTDSLLKREGGQAFLLTDVANPEAFSAAVCALAGDANERQRLGQEARKLYEREFSWDIVSFRFLSALGSKAT